MSRARAQRPVRGAGILAALLACLLAMPATAVAQTGSATQAAPGPEQVMVSVRDIGLAIDDVDVRSSVTSETGASALVELPDGTLVDVQLVRAADAWSVRDFSLVAGDPQAYRSWIAPWRARVAAAENFLASATATTGQIADARELAPLFWFEDPNESDRLWGMNPVTYRMMQALQMMPAGPMQGGTMTNPVPRRDDQ